MAFRNRIVRLSQLVADTLIGATIETAASGNRWVMAGGTFISSLLGYTGDAAETVPAQLTALADLIGQPALTIFGPTVAGFTAPLLKLRSIPAVGTDLTAFAGAITVQATGAAGITFKSTAGTGETVTLDSTGLAINGTHPTKGIDFGSGSVTLTAQASNSVVVPHGLGVVPSAVLVSVSGSTAFFLVSSGAVGAASFTVTGYTRTGATTTGAVPFYWLALA